ncbi:hypothetical protein OOK13_12915 [Streptomyces sp. NBC_00378]|uniref:hypothetical protein n=1 Tax=unclassified Streptomyces TaxID=2593676 RepID=UPI002256C7C6|nr:MULTISPECIES: hypothetical protein [unclassified Streptomyces]MCX5109418.1 hypothetical protein [Streptomyces sp. NBC_00378]
MNATSPAGALLLCRAEPETVGPVARLLRERMLLAPAGDGWSVLVPEGKPWQGAVAEAGAADVVEPVDRVVAGWAAALAVGSAWPVLALWWDGDRAGCTLASGFRRPVGYVWLADGTPAGEDEAMRTLAERLGLDPVLDVQALEELIRPDPDADARIRLRGLLAVLTRIGLILPPGLDPDTPGDRLYAAADDRTEAEPVARTGRREAVKAELDVVESSRLGPWMRGPRARALAGAQFAAGLPLVLWGIGRRRGGWVLAGALLLAHGALGLAYGRMRGAEEPADGRG